MENNNLSDALRPFFKQIKNLIRVIPYVAIFSKFGILIQIG